VPRRDLQARPGHPAGTKKGGDPRPGTPTTIKK